MKKITFIFLLGFTSLLLSCTANDYETNTSNETTTSVLVNNTVLGTPGRTDFAFIAQQLANSYKTYYNNTNATLYQNIVLLDSAAVYVPLFTALKNDGFVLPTTTEAQFFLTDYDYSYTDLDVSLQMMVYLDTIVETNGLDYVGITESIQADLILTTTEKMQLQFIVTYFNDTVGGPIDDDSWSKKNIVAAVKGFEKSNANAVFNVALANITQQ